MARKAPSATASCRCAAVLADVQRASILAVSLWSIVVLRLVLNSPITIYCLDFNGESDDRPCMSQRTSRSRTRSVS